MSYLTRIRIGKTQAARAALGDSYAWHRALWTAFQGRDGERRDFLFRVDDQRDRFEALLLSPALPEAPLWGLWETKEIPETFLEHATYRFQLRANPTMRRNSDRRRLGIFQEPALRDWILRKAEQNGFGVRRETLVVSAPMTETFLRNGRRGKHVSVDFSGGLSVTDRGRFRDAFAMGIGSAKAFGFGMLVLAPVPAATSEASFGLSAAAPSKARSATECR